MQEKQIEKLNRLLELVQNDTVTPKEIEQFLNVVVNLIAKERENFNSASISNINKIESALEFINSKYSETIESILEEKKSTSNEFSKQINEVKNLISELHTIKTTPVSDGKDADEEAIIESVLSKIEFPEHEKFELIGEDIVERINELPTDEDEYKIGFEHIKGIKEYVKENAVSTNIISNSNKYIKELLDVDLSGVTYNTTTKKYELGSGGGGTINNGQATTWNSGTSAVDLGGTYDTDIWITSENEASINLQSANGFDKEANFNFNTSTIDKLKLNQREYDPINNDWIHSELGVDSTNQNAYMRQYNYFDPTHKWEKNYFRVYADRIQSDKYPSGRNDTETFAPQNWIYTDEIGNFYSAPLYLFFDYIGTINNINVNTLVANTYLQSSTQFVSQGTSTFNGGSTFNTTATFNATSFFSGGISSTVTNLLNASFTNTQTGANALSSFNIAQTFNTTGTPTILKISLTDTASNANSLFVDFLKGGVSQFKVSKSGLATMLQATIGSFTLSSNTITPSINGYFLLNAARSYFFTNTAISNTYLQINEASSTATSGTLSPVTIPTSFAPTSGTAVMNDLTINPTINQTGSATGVTRGLYVNPTLTASVDFRAIETTAGKVKFVGTTQTGAMAESLLDLTQTWNTTGNPKALFANITNTASGSSSLLADLQVGGVSQFSVSPGGILTSRSSVISTAGGFQGATGSSYQWVSSSRINSPSNGVITLLNQAQTDFTRLQFGGSTSAFPSLKRSGTGLISRLADDSDDAPITASDFISTRLMRLKGYTVATLPAGTVGDTAYCTDLLTPGFLAIAVGGGSNVAPVFYNGTNWVTY